MADAAHRAPPFQLLAPFGLRNLGQRDAAFDAERLRIAARLADQAVQAIDDGLGRRARPEVGHPAVGDARHPSLHDLALAAHPDRDRPLHGQGIDAGVGDAVLLARERHQLAGPQRAHHLDLLLDRRPRVVKSSPSASNSTGFQPKATPSLSRPPESTSTAAACLATSAVWRCGRMMMPVTSSTRRVAAARNPKSTNGSWKPWRCVYGPFHPPGRAGLAPST